MSQLNKIKKNNDYNAMITMVNQVSSVWYIITSIIT